MLARGKNFATEIRWRVVVVRRRVYRFPTLSPPTLINNRTADFESSTGLEGARAFSVQSAATS